jgi:NADPH:quinone reductase-like Zn-dependent oxidoreductase
MFADLFALVEQGKLHPITDSTMPLEDFAQGLRRLTERSVVGKVVLLP